MMKPWSKLLRNASWSLNLQDLGVFQQNRSARDITPAEPNVRSRFTDAESCRSGNGHFGRDTPIRIDVHRRTYRTRESARLRVSADRDGRSRNSAVQTESSQNRFLFGPAVWKRFRQDRDGQFGRSRAVRNSMQELRSKKGQGRQAPNMTDTYSVPNSNLGEGKVHAAAEAAATLM